jgi:hypothetical protein
VQQKERQAFPVVFEAHADITDLNAGGQQPSVPEPRTPGVYRSERERALQAVS